MRAVSSSTGDTSVLRVAALATLPQVPARIFLDTFGRESQNHPVKKKPYARATVQLCHATCTREVVGTDYLSFREPFARSVLASCVPVLICS